MGRLYRRENRGLNFTNPSRLKSNIGFYSPGASTGKIRAFSYSIDFESPYAGEKRYGHKSSADIRYC
jgi:hypothetical protein